VFGVETADQMVQMQGGFPDFKHQAASRAGAPYGAEPIDRGVVSLVAGAAAVKFAGSDLHRFLSPYISRPRRYAPQTRDSLEFPARFAGNSVTVPGFAPRDTLPIRRALKTVKCTRVINRI
jgi:hypothetical protein